MRTLHPAKALLLRASRLRPAVLRGDLDAALAPYAPVGYCAAFSRGTSPAQVLFGGDAVAGETPVCEDTIFRAASISKMFGAEAAMILARRGQLSLDGDIGDVLGYPVRNPAHPGVPITLRMLLTHTASLRDAGRYDAVIGTPGQPPLRSFFDGEREASTNFFPFEPGRHCVYSNFGAGIAGMLVERVSGMDFDRFVRAEILLPAGLDASFHPQRIERKERLANCYQVRPLHLEYDARAIANAPLDESCDPERHYHIPAGKLMISAPSLLKLMRRQSPLLAEMKQLQGHSGRGLGYAYSPRGVFSGRAFWGHQGSAYGAIGEAWRDPETGDAAALLINGVSGRALFGVSLAGQAGVAAVLRRLYS